MIGGQSFISSSTRVTRGVFFLCPPSVHCPWSCTLSTRATTMIATIVATLKEEGQALAL